MAGTIRGEPAGLHRAGTVAGEILEKFQPAFAGVNFSSAKGRPNPIRETDFIYA